MDVSKTKSGVCLLRKPLPPSESYRLPFNAGNANGCSTCSSNKTRLAKTHSANTSSIPVPANTPYRNNRSTSKYDYHELYIHSLQPKGPAPLPPGKILSQGLINNTFGYDYEENIKPPEFTFNDFLLSPRQTLETELPKSTQIMLSRENYLKLTSWFVTQKPTQKTVSNWLADINLTPPDKRVPEHQLLIEFRAILKEISTEEVQAPSENVEDDEMKPVDQDHDQPCLQTSKDDILIQSSTSRFFCGEGRSQSPFESPNQPLASPGEVAILSAMVSGGSHLSLKAHFLSELPNLSPLSSTLCHLNLSYNSLQVFPTQLLELHELVCLRLRNNPIKEIPSGIKKLVNLEHFSIPFNLISDLPQGLFEVPNLRELDVSHNYLQWISRDIARLRNLEKLNVECNQLVGLPGTILSLSLSELKVDGNYFHPALWKENTRNQPQRLTEICCHVVETFYRDQPYSHRVIMKRNESGSYCDECNGKIYGTGLRLIRTNGQEQVLGHKCLPLIFQVCSPECHRTLKSCHEIIWNSECKMLH